MPQYNKNLKYTARALRKNMTEQEKNLWYKFLRNNTAKFVRQRVIGNYIVDFYCHSAKLVIEIDGTQHFEKNNISYDEIRTKYLNSLGLKVIRFTNQEVDTHFEGVCYKINELIKNCISNPSVTS